MVLHLLYVSADPHWDGPADLAIGAPGIPGGSILIMAPVLLTVGLPVEGIGILLGVTAFGLARPLAEFLIGKSLPLKLLQELREIAERSPAIEKVLLFESVYTGPEEVVIVARIHPKTSMDIEELTRALDDLDQKLRDASPYVADVYLDLTSYHSAFRTDGDHAE